MTVTQEVIPRFSQAGHLVGHEGHQGRDDHGEGAGLVVARQGGHLVADGLAGAGGQYSEQGLAQHGLLDYLLLQGDPVLARGLWQKVIEADPPSQLLGGIVALPAPPAAGLPARCVAEAS